MDPASVDLTFTIKHRLTASDLRIVLLKAYYCSTNPAHEG